MITPPSNDAAPIYGLVLAGGESARMGRDKATLEYHGEPQGLRCHRLLSNLCDLTFVSLSQAPSENHWADGLTIIVDRYDGIGPMDGVVTAMTEHPGVAWLVVACDLPSLSETALERLAVERDPQLDATAYSSTDGRPEPLFALYEPSCLRALGECLDLQRYSLRDFLNDAHIQTIHPRDARALINVNTPDDYERFMTTRNDMGGTSK